MEEERENKRDTSQNKEEMFRKQAGGIQEMGREWIKQGRCKNNMAEKGKPEALGDLETTGPKQQKRER